jgi:DNA (cytosine-5)-methyltransferase 1
VDESGTAYTLDGTQGQAVAQPLGGGSGARGWMNDLDHATYVPEQASVRRLTPTECMRLQGFPDWWFEGNDKSDGPMYRALGNAVTVPVLEWIGRRIMALEGGA